MFFMIAYRTVITNTFLWRFANKSWPPLKSKSYTNSLLVERAMGNASLRSVEKVLDRLS